MFKLISLTICVVAILITSYAYGIKKSPKFYGGWFCSDRYSVNFYEIKKDGTVFRFHKGCTDQGSSELGTFTTNADTISLYLNSFCLELYLYNGRLVPLKIDIDEISESTGLGKTWRRTEFGSKRKWFWEQRKRHKHLRKNNT